MKCDHAKAFLSCLCFLPGWEIACESWNHRYEGTVKVTVTVDNPNTDDTTLSDKGTYDQYVEGGIHASFLLRVGDLPDGDYHMLAYRLHTEIFRKVFDHEMREAMRDVRTKESFFHPHRMSGVERWSEYNESDPYLDYHYGTV